jgi:hypothetical protein
MTDTTEATGVDLFGAPVVDADATEAEGVTTLQPTVESLPAVQQGGAIASPLDGALVRFMDDPNVDVDKFERFLRMYQDSIVFRRQIEKEDRERDAVLAYKRDFVAMQGVLPRVKRDGTLEYPVDKNKPHGEKYKVANYAKWETIMAALQPVLNEYHFALSFQIGKREGDGGGLNVRAVLTHALGHETVGDPMPVPLDTSGGKNNAQAYASSLSYGKKYAAFAALNIVTEGEDDDGKTGGAMPLTEEEVDAVRGALMAAKLTDPEKITRFLHTHTNYHADSPEAILQSDLTRIMNLLTIMARQKGKGE